MRRGYWQRLEDAAREVFIPAHVRIVEVPGLNPPIQWSEPLETLYMAPAAERLQQLGLKPPA